MNCRPMWAFCCCATRRSLPSFSPLFASSLEAQFLSWANSLGLSICQLANYLCSLSFHMCSFGCHKKELVTPTLSKLARHELRVASCEIEIKMETKTEAEREREREKYRHITMSFSYAAGNINTCYQIIERKTAHMLPNFTNKLQLSPLISVSSFCRNCFCSPPFALSLSFFLFLHSSSHIFYSCAIFGLSGLSSSPSLLSKRAALIKQSAPTTTRIISGNWKNECKRILDLEAAIKRGSNFLFDCMRALLMLLAMSQHNVLLCWIQNGCQMKPKTYICSFILQDKMR